jgi:hypothetical protein
MMPPPAYTQARLTARFHVQVEYEPPRQLAPTGGESCGYVAVCASVRRVFRGEPLLRSGDLVNFSVPIYWDKRRILLGESWMSHVDFERGRFIELFLDGIPPECTICASQYKMIAAPSELPEMQIPTKEQLAEEWAKFEERSISSSRKWWQFWK